MNSTVYLFGELKNGYTQYPYDHTYSIFAKFGENIKSKTQIAIHREGNLMYYGYIRKLESKGYIGICVVVNDIYFTKIDSLFNFFENCVSEIVAQGRIIRFNEKGDIVSDVDDLKKYTDDINFLQEYLRLSLNHLDNEIMKLPAVSYGNASNSLKCYRAEENLSHIINSSYTNAYTFVYKSKGYNTESLNGYITILKGKQKEITELQDRNKTLQKDYQALERKQKRTAAVAWLSGIIVILLFVFFNIWSNMSQDIETKTSTINGLNGKVGSLTDELDITHSDLRSAEFVISQKDLMLERKSDSIYFLMDSLKLMSDSVFMLTNIVQEKSDYIDKLEADNGALRIIEMEHRNCENNRNNQLRGQEFNNSTFQEIKINDVQVANINIDDSIETGYGNKIRSRNTYYLKPKIHYKSNYSGYVTIFTKLFVPGGTLSRGSTSPLGFSYKDKVKIEEGENILYLSSWGSNYEGNWRSGKYKYEFYCEGVLIGSHDFYIH